MPRRNQPRSLFSEEGLAQRVGYERERRGWTYESLAARMTAVGCPINQSALYKIEKGEPRRRITVDELVALSRVLDTPVEHLLLPPELAATERLGELLVKWREAKIAADDAWDELQEYVAEHPGIDMTQVAERVGAAWPGPGSLTVTPVDFGESEAGRG